MACLKFTFGGRLELPNKTFLLTIYSILVNSLLTWSSFHSLSSELTPYDSESCHCSLNFYFRLSNIMCEVCNHNLPFMTALLHLIECKCHLHSCFLFVVLPLTAARGLFLWESGPHALCEPLVSKTRVSKVSVPQWPTPRQHCPASGLLFQDTDSALYTERRAEPRRSQNVHVLQR